ncbi:olfactory receptor 11L1-like [Pelobates fuscus]|uniref:olfactory receptor 11L1-like n=1 Tax=Pelobates fuscus TaxID=191477 RepID=UPI002FE4EF45
MHAINQTIVTEFLLLGFQNLQSFKILIFVFFLILYLVTLCGNLLIIWLVVSNNSLQSPMYIFLTHLSISDLLLTTVIVPNTLYIIYNEGGTMSFSGCVAQFSLYAFSEVSECFVLSIMAYDRYMAICKPLRYSTLMNPVVCIKMIIISCILILCMILTDTLSLIQLHFCGPNIINHFFCDLVPLMELSCSDTYYLEVNIYILSIFVIISPFLIITGSYVYIIQAVLRISTTSGRWKTFSTCSSHLTVVGIFFGTVIGSYMVPAKGKSLTVSKCISLFYTVVTPMINPIIYSLRNRDIKEAIKKLCKISEHFHMLHNRSH